HGPELLSLLRPGGLAACHTRRRRLFSRRSRLSAWLHAIGIGHPRARPGPSREPHERPEGHCPLDFAVDRDGFLGLLVYPAGAVIWVLCFGAGTGAGVTLSLI